VPILGFESFYEVSNYGKLRRILKSGRKTLKSFITKDGYLSAAFTVNYKKTCKKVHRIVAESFLGKYDSMCVNHIDGNKLNNYINNLEWVSTRENCVHRSSMKKKSSKYPNITWDKDRNKWRAQIYIDGKQVYIGIFNDEQIAYEKLCLFLYHKEIQNKYL
jgi:hypothetical protein